MHSLGQPSDLQSTSERTWSGRADDCKVEDLAQIVRAGNATSAVSAQALTNGIPVYDASLIAENSGDGSALMTEIAAVLRDGPGTLIVRKCISQDAVERATEAFAAMIDRQRRTGGPVGDHFAKPGANDRIWNSLEKLALEQPAVFVDYYASVSLECVCRAWLGPAYQMTSQVNVVNPGGEAQSPHRDYHLGFMTEADAERFPRHTHLMSPLLTLQAGIAHGDVPLASGPTKLLPHSQKYEAGYLAWRRSEFIDFFEHNAVQAELSIGDALFFNPALFHGAGSNYSQEPRMVNLLQISSAMGRSMEAVDRRAVAAAIYPALLERESRPDWSPAHRAAAIAAAAEGYAFPNDLDRHQPEGRLTPITGAEVMHSALAEGWSFEKLSENLR